MNKEDPIDELELTGRCQNVLNSMGVKTIGCILERTYQDFASQKNMGKKTIDDLVDSLHFYGFRIPETPLENHIKRTAIARLVEMSEGEVQMLVQCPECFAAAGHTCDLDMEWYGTICEGRRSLSETLLLERVGQKISCAFNLFNEAQKELNKASRKVVSATKGLDKMSPYVKRTFLKKLEVSKCRERRLEFERIEKLKVKPNITVSNDDGSVSKVSAFNGDTVAQFWYPSSTTGEEDECK